MKEELFEDVEARKAKDPIFTSIISEDLRASFKIEVHFGPGRTDRSNFKALVVPWESGKFFHGGGDGQIYLCMDHRLFEKNNTTSPSALPLLRRMTKERTEYGCGAPIGSAQIVHDVALCRGCQKRIQAKFLTGQIPFFGTTRELAEMTEILFRRLEGNADVYCKYHPTDIRYQGASDFKNVEKARQGRVPLIYTLRRIIQDTSGGASLVDRFVALFRA